MRIEREHNCGAADLAGLSQESLDDAGMAAMHAVEVADRHRSAAKVGWQVVKRAEETHAVG
jgi:hypothetical protein